MPVLRAVVYLWALPTSVLGMLFLLPALLGGGGVRFRSGTLEIWGGACTLFLRRCTLLRGGAAAMTLGHVVLGQDRDCLDRCRQHELVHVRQVERWGPLFIPAYLVASLIAWARGEDPYLDNRFEREAYQREKM